MKDIYNSEICKILYLQRLWFYDILLIKKWYFIIFIYFLLFSKKSIWCNNHSKMNQTISNSKN